MIRLYYFLVSIYVLLCSNCAIAQNAEFNWSNELITYYSQNPVKGNIFFKRIMSSGNNNFSLKELRTLSYCMAANHQYGITNNKNDVIRLMSNLLDSLNVLEVDFSRLSIEKKRNLIKDYMLSVEPAMILYSCFEDDNNLLSQKLTEHLSYFTQNIYGYRKILNVSDSSELETIASIYRVVALYMYYLHRYDIVLLNIYPDVLELLNSSIMLKYHFIHSVMPSIKDAIITFGYTDSGTKYIKEITNFLLQYNDLELYTLGCTKFKNFQDAHWAKIRSSLKKDECAVMMYKFYLLGKVPLISGIAIIPDSLEPVKLSVSMSDVSPDEYIKSIEKINPAIKKIYLCPIGEWEDVDVAYCNEKIYIKYSLSDLVGSTGQMSLNDKHINLFANIEYGKSSSSRDKLPLNEGVYLINELTKMYGSKIHSLCRGEVRKINFYNIIEDVGILHISTHGIATPKDIEHKSVEDLARTILGDTSLKGYGLALSNYNIDNSNFISAAEIKQMKYNNHLLVYLDACLTGVTNESLIGRSGLSKSFYIAGVGSIIAYNIEVKEEFATEFAIQFYRELHDNPFITYHDAFYKTKKNMKRKYENSNLISKDRFGRPNLGILLWE